MVKSGLDDCRRLFGVCASRLGPQALNIFEGRVGIRGTVLAKVQKLYRPVSLMLTGSILPVVSYLKNIDKYDFIGIGEIDFVPRADNAGNLLNERVTIK
ncbi:THUMP domain-containing protein [Colletotrichum scovillei]|uniref:THUMP domain-containing protein n=1 Tax=Colletotrichum scovillei TaxID=1209932 RepID=A0A9P7QU37_9PEZI|nr:THUMP domain-containing protein [Colletotrichum scovillei]KAG7043505.1 THUMP domain-containing protein [Colletotrichum scovillei]KAG7062954.1 THUMP domain-containing protein [Colletotrichum scovillei]